MDSTMNLSGIKVLMIIAFEKFRDEEFLVPKEFLNNLGAEITVASTKNGTASGAFGASVKVDKTIDEIESRDYDAVIFVGGAGTPTVRKSEKAITIAKNMSKNKIVGAICWAPTILAKAGVLEGKKSTVWVGDDSEYNKTTPEVIKHFGGIFVDKPVIVDSNIVTGNGPAAAEEFAKAISKALLEKFQG